MGLLDAVRAFAGDDISTAVVEPEAQAAVLAYDTTVTHRTVMVDSVSDAR
ncbi:hypothetical protein [Actinomadura sp. K4S16]|nr:hypothetical protein [Actinomadura sp. K4S16]